MAARQTNVARVPPPKQRCLDTILASSRRLPRPLRVLHVVVYALRYEDQIGKAEVDCESDYGRDETCPYGASEVGDVAYEPDCEEGKGYAIC